MEPGRNLMSKAFASGEPVVNWILRGIDLPSDKVAREKVYDFVMTILVREGLATGGMVFGKPNEEDAKELECGILFKECDREKDFQNSILKQAKLIGRSLGTYFGLARSGVAAAAGPFSHALFSNTVQTYFNRGTFYDKTSSAFHAKHGPKTLHWYISAVGVDPDSQGKGLGKTLLGKMGDLADQVGMSVYLECAGAKNKGFYQKMGFAETAVEFLEDGTDDSSETLYLMIRPLQQ
jgi:GNAT superfamily N-acetyltransferase